MFGSQEQAKRFFVDKVLAQAAREGVQLSEPELLMLSFSESEAESPTKSALVHRLEQEISDEDYEAKIVGLLRRSYKHDLASGDGARELYGEASAVLATGDHYLLVMVEQAIGLGAGTRASGLLKALRSAGLFAFLVLPGAGAFLMAAGLLLALIGQDSGATADVVPIGFAVLLLAAFGVYLIRLWFRERTQ